MEKEYIFGYLPSEADKMTLDEIYTYLIDKGVIDNTVSKNDLAIILEGVIKSITPDMIRGNVTIAGVTGNVATKVEEIYVDKFDEVEIPEKEISQELDYSYYGYDYWADAGYLHNSTNGIDSYAVPNVGLYAGIYYKNLETGETEKIDNTAYILNSSFKSDNGNILLKSTQTSCRGLYVLSGRKVTRIFTSTAGSNISFLKMNDNTIYATDKSNSTYRVDCTSPYSVLSDGIFRIYTSIDGRVYAIGCKGVYSYNNTVFTLLYSATYNVSDGASIFEASNGDIYIGGSTNSRYDIVYIKSSTNTAFSIDVEGTNYRLFYENSVGGIYVSSSSNNVYGLYYIKDYNISKVIDTGYSWAHFVEKSSNVYIWSHSFLGGVFLHNIEDNTYTQIYESFAGCRPLFDEHDNIYLISTNTTAKGILYITGTNAMLIDTVSYTSYNTTGVLKDQLNGKLYLIEISYKTGVHYVCDGNIHTIVTTSNWRYIIEDPSGTYINSSNGFIYLNGTDSVILATSSYGSTAQLHRTKDGVTIAHWISSTYKGVYLLAGADTICVSTIMYNARILEASTGLVYLISTDLYVCIDGYTILYTYTPPYKTGINYIYETPTNKILLMQDSRPDNCIANCIYLDAVYALTLNNYSNTTYITPNYTYYCKGTTKNLVQGAIVLNNYTNELDVALFPYTTSTYYFIDNKLFPIFTSEGSGIIYLDGPSTVQLYSTGGSWYPMCVDNNHNIYFSSNNSTYKYVIVCDANNVCTETTTALYGIFNSYTTMDGTILVCPTSQSSNKPGIHSMKNGVFTKVSSGAGADYASFFEASNGDVYVYNTSDSGIIRCIYYGYTSSKNIPISVEYYNMKLFKIVYESDDGTIYGSCIPQQYSSSSTYSCKIKNYTAITLPSNYCALTGVVTHNNSTYLMSPSVANSSNADMVFGAEGIAYVCDDTITKIALGYKWTNHIFNGTEYLTAELPGSRTPAAGVGQPRGVTYKFDKDKILLYLPYIIPFENYIHMYNNVYLFYTNVIDGNHHNEWIYYANLDTEIFFIVAVEDIENIHSITLLKNNDIILCKNPDSIHTGVGVYIIHNDTLYTSTQKYKEDLHEI